MDAGGEKERQTKKKRLNSIPVVVFWVSYAFRIDIAPGQGVWRFFFSFSFFSGGGGVKFLVFRDVR